MREALYQFIQAYYTGVLSILPSTLLLVGLLIAVGIDSYIQKWQKRIMLIICALVFSLIVQNIMDNWLTFGKPMIMLRRVVDIYGYSILLGVLKRRNDKKGGIAAIVIAVLAIIIAFGMNNTWSNMFKDLHNKAVETMPDGLWAQASDDANGGLMGVISKIPTDEASLNALVEEMNQLNKLTEAN